MTDTDRVLHVDPSPDAAVSDAPLDDPVLDDPGLDDPALDDPLLDDPALDEGTEHTPVDGPAWFIPVEVVDVELTLPSTHPVLILEEINGDRRQLRIPIGIAEGSAIAYALRSIPTPRPLTHEFATKVFEATDVALETVRITEVIGSIYSAEAVFSSPMGLRTITCRPSDGVCFALRQTLVPPISVAADVLDEMGYAPTGD